MEELLSDLIYDAQNVFTYDNMQLFVKLTDISIEEIQLV